MIGVLTCGCCRYEPGRREAATALVAPPRRQRVHQPQASPPLRLIAGRLGRRQDGDPSARARSPEAAALLSVIVLMCRGTADGAPDEGGGTHWPVGRRLEASEGAGVPGPGAQSLRYEVSRGVEEPEHFVLRIEWDSVEGREQGFRSSPRFAEFVSAVRPFIPQIQEMKHYEPRDRSTRSAPDHHGTRAQAMEITKDGPVVEPIMVCRFYVTM